MRQSVAQKGLCRGYPLPHAGTVQLFCEQQVSDFAGGKILEKHGLKYMIFNILASIS
jgi:hypothetical protein